MAITASIYQHDYEAGEWVTTCPTCGVVAYYPTLRETLKQHIRHTRTKCLNGY